MPNIYRDYRKQAGKTVERAAEELNVSPRTLYRYEAGEIDPPPDVVYKMARVYKSLSLIRYYCASVCHAGKGINPPVLDNINSSPPAKFFKYYEELEESVPLARELTKLVIDKGMAPVFNDEEMDKIELIAEQVLTDVAQAWSEAWDAYCEVFGVEAAEKLWKRHRQKMEDRGYIKRVTRAGHLAERKATYTFISRYLSSEGSSEQKLSTFLDDKWQYFPTESVTCV